MPTPNFKVLMNALKLGQPAEPSLAIKALVEAISAQQKEMEELRQRMTLLISRVQIAEARANRLEGLLGEGGHSPRTNTAQPAARAPSVPPPARGHAGLRTGMSQPPPNVRPVYASVPRSSFDLDSDSFDGFNGTVVASKADLERAVQAEAPFPLAPPGSMRRPNDRLPSMGTPFIQPSEAHHNSSPPPAMESATTSPQPPPRVPFVETDEVPQAQRVLDEYLGDEDSSYDDVMTNIHRRPRGQD